jgi:cbb3-type cytochrome oxidase subunit 3
MTDNREMKCMEFKAQMIFVVQMILILVSGVWFIFAEWNYWN